MLTKFYEDFLEKMKTLEKYMKFCSFHQFHCSRGDNPDPDNAILNHNEKERSLFQYLHVDKVLRKFLRNHENARGKTT
jgi:hypothetical protein